jgi:hypothetical protein
MNNETIIEQLLQTPNEQILNTSLDALDLSPGVYRSLWRSRIRTVGDIADAWKRNRNVPNIGEQARSEILGALQAWYLSRQNLTNPARAEDQAETEMDAAGCAPTHETLTKTYVITDSGVVVSVDLLQAEESRRSREERWRNVPPTRQDYSPRNAFQAIDQGTDKISSPIRRPKKPLDGSVPISSEWREMSLHLLEKARTSRQIRTINCPICMARTLSIRFKEHLVTIHPQAFQELKKASRHR